MWTNWLERTLDAHDAAEYAALRALRPSLDEVETALAHEAFGHGRPDKSPLRLDELTPKPDALLTNTSMPHRTVNERPRHGNRRAPPRRRRCARADDASSPDRCYL